MKKILYFTMALAAMAIMPSCMDVDNVKGPDCSVSGKIIDETTDNPIELGHGENTIRIWEMSYSDANAAHVVAQDLRIQQSGEYANNKLFGGSYDMLPYSGPWWPCDTVYGVKIGKNTKQDFYVTPYLKVIDFEAELIDATTLQMSCRLYATYPEGKEVKGEMMAMPNVKEVRPFLSLNQYCGKSSSLGYYYSNTYRKGINKPFTKIASADDPHISKDTYTFKLPVKAEYVYWVRIGACMNDEFQAFIYSPVVEIHVPTQEQWDAEHPTEE